MMFLKKKTTLVLAAVLSLISLFFSSCEVGLGSAVDTQPPSVGIDYPPSLSVVRDSFVFAGTWKDDKQIEDVFVEVYLKKDESRTLVYSDTAERTDEGEWTISLNEYNVNNAEYYNGWQFCDGDYEIQVYAKDKAGQISGIASRTIIIDNTAPILMLTNPTTTGNDASTAVFGQIVQLTGNFYEASGKISNLTVSFYDENGNAICDSNFTNITNISNSSPLVIARYFSTDEERMANKKIFDNYVAILGQEQLEKFDNNEAVPDKKIYFSVTASDEAKIYQTLGDSGVGEGNKSKVIYRGTTSMQNLVSGDGGIKNFSLADFGQFINETDASYAEYSEQINNTATAAQSLSVTNEGTNSIAENISNTLTFNLNPRNNPTFSFGGYEIIDTPVTDPDSYSNEGFKFLYSGTSVPLNITLGVDNKNISTHTVSIYKIDRTNYTGEISEDLFTKENFDKKYYELMWTWNSDVKEKFEGWSINIDDIYTPTDEDSNIEAISKQFLIKSFEAAHCYEFYVVGKDIVGNEIVTLVTKGYGFYGKIPENAPIINVKEGYPNNSIINEAKLQGSVISNQDGILYISGEVRTAGFLTDDEGLSYSLTISDSEASDRNPVIITNNIAPQILEAEPDYSANYIDNYCYTVGTETPHVYKWRFTTKEIAEASEVKELINNHPSSYDLSLEITAQTSPTSYASITRTFTLDSAAPAPDLSEISVAVEHKTEVNKYWINPAKALTVSGLVTDNLSTAKSCKTWIKLLAIDENGNEINSGTNWEYKSSELTQVNKWEFTIPANSIAASGAKMYIYSQDVAGNVNRPEPIILLFDTQAPAGKHLIDSSLKDLYFRVGEQDRDDFIKIENDNPVATDGGPDYDASLDKNVGGKYSKGTYGNTNTITLRGNFEDSGSGVKMIYYKVYQGEGADPSGRDLDILKKEVKNSPTGKFAPGIEGTDKIKRVFYNDENGNGSLDGKLDSSNYWDVTVDGKKKYYTEIESNFLTTISGFTSGENYLVLVAEDNVGNYAIDVVSVPGSDGNETTTDWNNFSINVDQELPSIKADDAFNTTVYTNRVSDTRLWGIAEDTGSGVRSIEIEVDGKKITTSDTTYGSLEIQDSGSETIGSETVTYSKKKTKWSVSIKAEAFPDASGNIPVYATVTDDAGTGNSQKVSIATVNVDVTEPTVTLTAPADADTSDPAIQVNGTISLSGTASDANGLKEETTTDDVTSQTMKLYYTTSSSLGGIATAPTAATFTSGENASTTWVQIGTAEHGTSWTFSDINTAKLDGTNAIADKTTVYFTVAVTDKAGNVGYAKPLTVIVDQDTDRPVIKFTNLTLGEMSSSKYLGVAASELYGTITDDDGVSGLYYQSADSDSSLYDGNWESVDVSNGSFTISFDDGKQHVYFKVLDSAGKEYISSENDSYSLTAPKLTDSSGNKYGYRDASSNHSQTVTYLKVDTVAPAGDSIEFCLDPDSTTPEWSTSISAQTFGGTNKTFYLHQYAYDANDVASVTLVITPDSNDEGWAEEDYKKEFTKQDETRTYNSKTYYEWLSPEIDVTGLASGSRIFTVTISDGTKTTSTTVNIAVDNTAPNITISAPSSSTTQSGGITAYGIVDEAAYTYYAISPSGTIAPSTGTAITKWYDSSDAEGTINSGYTPSYSQILSGKSLSWYLYFDGGSDTATQEHDNTLAAMLSSMGITTADAISSNNFTSVVKLYLWIKAVDEQGNYSEKCSLILLDPQGDRPTIEINYPESNNTSVGGTVKLYGTAEDNEAVKSVWVQLISNTHAYSKNSSNETYNYGTTYGSGTYNEESDSITKFSPTADDWDYLKFAGYKIYEMSTYETSPKEWAYNSSDEPTNYGILATFSGTSWSLKINVNGELNPSSGGINPVFVKVMSYDGGKFSIPSYSYMKFDSDNPVISEMYLKQYSDASPNYNSTSTASKEYTDSMYVKGKWYLTFTASDSDQIGNLYIGTSTVSSADAQTTAGTTSILTTYGKDISQNTNGSVYGICYPLDTDSGLGTVYVYVSVEDGKTDNPGTKTASFTINYDNTSPTLAGVADSEYDIKPAICQNNGFYTFSSKVEEPASGGVSQSGFDYLAFYFVRRETSTTKIFDPMQSKDSENTYKYYTQIDSNLTYEDGIYWSSQSVTRSADNLNILTLGTADRRIHVGGLVKVGGSIYMITAMSDTAGASGSTVTIDGNPAYSSSSETVYFALANVVNNTVSETGIGTISTTKGYGYGYYSTVANDDGDCIVEEVSKSGSKWIWEASICSKNIPDGPIELHYVAFDKAGNWSKGIVGNKPIATYATYSTADATAYRSDSSHISVYAYEAVSGSPYYSKATAAFISNNAPRLARISVGTDYNGNNVVDTTEYKEDTISYSDWKTAQTSWELGKSTEGFITAKGMTSIKPEILGGNGNLYYSYVISSPSDQDAYTITGKNENAFITDTVDDNAARKEEPITLQVGDFTNLAHDSGSTNTTTKGILDTKDYPLRFALTIWDSTESTTHFEDSQSASVNVYMYVALDDSTSPKGSITPFYWNSASENSLYGNSTANGHIELEADLPKTFTDSSEENDTDPKVSGQIVIKGEVSDNKMLSKLYLKVPGMENQFSTAGLTNYATEGDYKDFYPMASYDASSSTWTCADKWDTYGFKFEMGTDEFTSEKHSNSWTFSWDTSKISDVAATDVAVQLLVVDQKSSSSVDSTGEYTSIDGSTKYAKPSYSDNKPSELDTTQTTSSDKTPYYQMDVVPYIAGVKTSLSSIKKGNSSIYDRTALGHYPVSSTETIYVYGFNLAGGTLSDAGTHTANLTAATAATQKWYSESAFKYTDVYRVGSIANFTSGKVQVTVNEVQSLNNENADGAKGAYTGTTTSATGDYSIYANYYNRQPNGDSNNLLTDDVVLDVWEFNSQAAVSISGKIEQPHMAIDPITGQIGFAFVNGPLYFSMGGSTENDNKTSYDYWMGSFDFFTSVAFAYDSLGYSYGVAAGGDINNREADKFKLMTSRLGISDRGQGGSYGNTSSFRLESIGQKGDSAGNNTGTINFDKQRIKSPALATAVHGDNTNVYLAYYDALNEEIRFKAGNSSTLGQVSWSFGNAPDLYQISENFDNNGNRFAHIRENGLANDNIVQVYDENKKLAEGFEDKYYLVKEWGGDPGRYWFRLEEINTSLQTQFEEDPYKSPDLATGGNVNSYPLGSTTDPTVGVGTYVRRVDMSISYDKGSFIDYDINKEAYVYRHETVSMIAGSDTGRNAGSYVSLAVIPGTSADNDVVVAVWYDETERQLQYAYNTSPQTNRNGQTNGKEWTVSTIFTGDLENAGEYCQLAVDANGGIHIAAYDGTNCDLVYAYLPSYNGDAETCVVDANGVLGSNLTIDVALDADDNAIPRIGYYATSCIRPKLAYLVDTSSTLPDGSENDAFTGKWECTVIPTSSNVTMQSNQYNKMNVAVWKNADGTVKNSETGTSSTTNTPNGYDSTSYGYVWGNGTANAVMGYAIKVDASSDAIETAQMR